MRGQVMSHENTTIPRIFSRQAARTVGCSRLARMLKRDDASGTAHNSRNSRRLARANTCGLYPCTFALCL
jgi:hypothetical protein